MRDSWKRWALMVPVGLLLWGGAVRADTVPSGMYAEYTRQMSQSRDYGYQELFAPDVYDLQEGESASEGMTLTGGTYRFKAICDDDCSDIDLELRDSQGRMVDSDTLSDDLPILTFTVPAGRYTARLTMASCSWEPCGAVLMYLKQR